MRWNCSGVRVAGDIVGIRRQVWVGDAWRALWESPTLSVRPLRMGHSSFGHSISRRGFRGGGGRGG